MMGQLSRQDHFRVAVAGTSLASVTGQQVPFGEVLEPTTVPGTENSYNWDS